VLLVSDHKEITMRTMTRTGVESKGKNTQEMNYLIAKDDIIDRNEHKLNEISNDAHDSEPNSTRCGNLNEF